MARMARRPRAAEPNADSHLIIRALVQSVGHLIDALVDDAQRLAHLLQSNL